MHREGLLVLVISLNCKEQLPKHYINVKTIKTIIIKNLILIAHPAPKKIDRTIYEPPAKYNDLWSTHR